MILLVIVIVKRLHSGFKIWFLCCLFSSQSVWPWRTGSNTSTNNLSLVIIGCSSKMGKIRNLALQLTVLNWFQLNWSVLVGSLYW